jgi:hypothetical protein
VGWVPSIPTITKARGKDGKQRFYIVAHHSYDIEVMLREAGLALTGIHAQDNDFLTGYYRILRSWEFRQLKKRFP